MTRPDSSNKTPLHWGALWTGLLVFGVLDFAIYWIVISSGDSTAPAGDRNPSAVGVAVVLTIAMILVAALTIRRHPSFTYGFFAGYVLMTIVSGGHCTLGIGESFEYAGMWFGAYIYPIAVVLIGVVLVVWRTVGSFRGRRDNAGNGS
jgi:hypothetical protein